jgi:hypothetical protein
MFQLAKRIRKYNGMQIVITQNIKDFVGSEELARKSTAIINACQYSMIFALAPNDIQDLVKLYENAGGINESEQEQIVQAPRGLAFAIMSPTSRSTFQINTAEGIADMFQEREYRSRYFTGEEGARNWEDFVAVSRERRIEMIGDELLPEPEEPEAETAGSGRVVLNIFDEDEYAAFADEEAELQSEPGGVTFSILDGEEQEEELPALSPAPERVSQGFTAEPMGSEAVFGAIASALSRMADAAERGGAAAAGPLLSALAPQGPAPAAEPQADAATAALEERLREMDERLRQLQEENERLRTEAYAPEVPEPVPEPEPEPEPVPEPEYGPFDHLADDAYPDEEDGELVTLYEEASGREEADETKLNAVPDKVEAEAEAEDEDESEDESEDDEGEDFMSAFCSFAATLMNMTAFERMRANGTDVMEISFEELSAEVKARAERRSRGA